jgi:hypothetical protein
VSPRRSRFAVIALLACVATTPAGAQLGGSNLLIGQVGNWPSTFPDRGSSNRQSFYDQVNMSYLFGSGLVGARFETDRNSDEQFEYAGFTQRFVDWNESGYRLRVGNFYTILGRGLVHRSFELTGVVIEKTAPRTRLAPSRDVDGVLAEVEQGPMSLRLMSGSPSEGFTSLAEEEQLDVDRHRGQISGGQLALTVYRGSRLGATYLRSTGGTTSSGLPDQHETGSGFVEFDPLRMLGVERIALPVYAEYAQEDRTFSEWWELDTSDGTAHALYTSTNVLWGPVAVSAEWKDYSQFRLGTNDPPSLIREHWATLLNRSTHLLDAQGERGYQLEASYTPAEWGSILVNRTHADGRGDDQFQEHYVELHALPEGGARWEGTAFYDHAYDSLTSITRRDTYGALMTVRFRSRYAATLDAQRQTAERVSFVDPSFTTIGLTEFQNDLVSLTGSYADRGSVSVVWERTTDHLDRSWEFGRTTPLDLFSCVVSARLADRHDATLFMGKRRGGLACTAGTCYEVQPFEGVELRVVTRF